MASSGELRGIDYAATFKKSEGPDAKWAELEELGKSDRTSQIDWLALEQKARAFQLEHPTDSRAVQSRKMELKAALRLEAKEGIGKSGLDEKVTAYLSDTGVPAADRFDISAEIKALRLKAKKASRAEQHAEHLKNARQLIAEFPEDVRGYGYLVALAKAQPRPQAEEIVDSILKSSAPEAVKSEAKKVKDQRALEGQRLSLSTFDLSSYNGKALIIYTWSKKTPEVLSWIKKWHRPPELQLVGINIDTDPTNAPQLVAAIGTPGVQIYDNRRLTEELKFTSTTSVYLVDRKGVLRDVLGQIETEIKIAQLDGDKGGVK